MSIINEALKKAQRLRTDDVLEAAAPLPAGGVHIAKHSKAHSANSMVLLGSGGIVLVVLSVVFTVYWVNRPGETLTRTASAAVAAAASTPSAVSEGTAATRTPIVAPVISSPISVSAPAETTAATSPAATTPVTPPPAPAPAPATLVATSTPPATTASAPVGQTAAPAPAEARPAPAPAASNAPDERISAFVDAVRVTGIRSSGTESRVLMNERVYRVNDIVERTLNLRLIKVAADSLTFSDARGVTYVKYF